MYVKEVVGIGILLFAECVKGVALGNSSSNVEWGRKRSICKLIKEQAEDLIWKVHGVKIDYDVLMPDRIKSTYYL